MAQRRLIQTAGGRDRPRPLRAYDLVLVGCACAAAAYLLAVVLHDVRRPRLGLGRIEPRLAPSLPLVEEVVRPVEFDLDRLEPLDLRTVEAASVTRCRVEALLLLGQGVDAGEDIRVVHGGLLLVAIIPAI